MVNMKKKLIVHVGTPKTGTSFLQSLCIANYKTLSDAGIIYPGLENGHFIKDANTSTNASNILALFFSNEDKVSICNKIKTELELVFNFNFNTVLISDETLIAFNTKGHGNLYIFECLILVCNELNIEVSFIGYYREPAKYIPSHWAQIVRKHQHTLTLIDFSENHHIPYWNHLINLNNLHKNVSIYSYDRELKKEGGIKTSFFKELGIDNNLIAPLKNSKINTSLSLNTLTAVRLLNGEFDVDIIKEIEGILTKANPIQKLQVPKLTPEFAEIINNKYLDAIQELDILAK